MANAQHPAPGAPPAAKDPPATSQRGGPASDPVLAAATEIVDYVTGEPARTKAKMEALPVMKNFTEEARKQALTAEVAAKIQAAVEAQVAQITGVTPPKKDAGQSQSQSAPATHAA